ncbi:sugar-phosphatase [Vibrio maerlii]|uniref:sugar-phosphatase n=1 Tax=Vibrio maerlii TaxID=2231648 RepID=UPI000E3D73C7|nr:sugar-phosphatase [Vibrio maerlii]
MYKLLALDMDGTLLGSDHQISDENKQAIQRAKEQGVTVVLASGRPLKGMQRYLDELKIDSEKDFVLFFNGSMVKNVQTGEIIHAETISGQSAKEVARLAKELGVNVHAFSEIHGLITPKNSEFTQHEANINKLTITEMDFDELEDNHPIIKAMLVDEPEKLSKAIEAIPSKWRDEYTIVQSAPFFLEFLNPKANKGVGIEAIANHLGINAEEVICMGDAENDHHMIKYAGLGVAMANAMEQTKAIANHVTVSNNEHGVAKVIEEFILAGK